MSSMITKKLRRWEIANFLVVGIAGPLLHFAYEWSGHNSIIAAFSAVNESTWEHMKIFFLPLFLMTLLEMMVFTERYRNFLAVKTVAVLAGTALIPVLYYTYTGVWGRGSMAADIAIFYIGQRQTGGGAAPSVGGGLRLRLVYLPSAPHRSILRCGQRALWAVRRSGAALGCGKRRLSGQEVKRPPWTAYRSPRRLFEALGRRSVWTGELFLPAVPFKKGLGLTIPANLLQ